VTAVTEPCLYIHDICRMEIFGYAAAALIGVSLGLIGGGGSILTVPVLVYLFKLDAATATSYSLFIVGSTSLVGAVKNYLAGQTHLKTAFIFGISSVITVLITRRLLLPLVPEEIFSVGSFSLSKQTATLVLFAVLMLLASISMIKDRKPVAQVSPERRSYVTLLLYGIGVGLVTGALGAGGGFLLIPALVLVLGLPMKQAVGTSLLIIAMNSLIGFTGDVSRYPMDWQLLLTVTAIAISGIFAGFALGKKISGQKLKKGFGWFVLVMGIYILARELYGTMHP
jgi:uncharacterized protein